VEKHNLCIPFLLIPTLGKSVSNCFYYVVTIALSVITDRLICIELFMCFNINHCSIHLWGMYTVKQTTVSQSQQWVFTSESTILPTYLNQAFEKGGQNRTENSLLLLNYDVFWCKKLENIISEPQRTIKIKKQFMTPLNSTQTENMHSCKHF